MPMFQRWRHAFVCEVTEELVAGSDFHVDAYNSHDSDNESIIGSDNINSENVLVSRKRLASI
jgi:hypothetical protein